MVFFFMAEVLQNKYGLHPKGWDTNSTLVLFLSMKLFQDSFTYLLYIKPLFVNFNLGSSIFSENCMIKRLAFLLILLGPIHLSLELASRSWSLQKLSLLNLIFSSWLDHLLELQMDFFWTSPYASPRLPRRFCLDCYS